MSFRRKTKHVRRYLHSLIVRWVLWSARLLPYRLLRPCFSFTIGNLLPVFIRAEAEKNLRLAFGAALTQADRSRLIRRVARNLGLFVAETLAMKRRDGAFFDLRIDPGELPEVGARLLAEGKGVIGLTGHVGNWELLGHQCARMFPGRFVAVVANRIGNRWINALVERERSASRLTTIYQHESPRKILRLLAENKSVGIVPDQDVDALGGLFVPFFGAPAYTPSGPAWLCVRSGAPILPIFLLREGDRLRFHLEEPIRPVPGADRDAEVERVTRAWSAAVEKVIREHPDQWVWFHRRWRTTPERLASRGRKAGRTVQPT
jgi:KDO2-lipid IV(A) lauroyltransferase